MTGIKQSTPRFIYLVLLIFILLFSVLSFRYWPSEIDDVYIDLLHARNLAEHGKLTLDFGDKPVEGFSSPLNVFLHALFFYGGLDPIFFSKFRGLLAGICSIFLTYLLTYHLSHNRYLALFSAGILSLTPSFQYWSVSGLETPIYTFFLVLAIYLLITQPLYSAIPLGLLSFTRPEGLIFFFPGIMYIFVDYLEKRSGRALVRLLLWIGMFVTIAAPYFIFRFFYFHSLFPNTYYAKINDFVSPYAGIVYCFDFLVHYAPYAFLAMPFLFISGDRIRKELFLVLAFLCAQIVVIIRAGGDWMPKFRFMTMVLPLIITASALAVHQLIETVLLLKSSVPSTTKGKFNYRIGFRVFAGFTVGVCILLGIVYLGFYAEKKEGMQHFPVLDDIPLRRHKDIYSDVAALITAEIKRQHRKAQDLTIALEPVGVIPFFTRTQVLDLSGKTNRDIARSLLTFGPKLEREKDLYVSEIFYRRLPEFFCYSGGMNPGHQEVIMADPRFEVLYDGFETIDFVKIFIHKIHPENSRLRFFNKADELFEVNPDGSFMKVETDEALKKSQEAFSKGITVEIFSRFDSVPYWFKSFQEAGSVILRQKDKYFWRFEFTRRSTTEYPVAAGLSFYNAAQLSGMFAPGSPEWSLVKEETPCIRLHCQRDDTYNLLSVHQPIIQGSAGYAAEVTLKVEHKEGGNFGLYWSTYRDLPMDENTVIEAGNTTLSGRINEWRSLTALIPLSEDTKYLSIGVGGYKNKGGILLIKNLKVTPIAKVPLEK
jgi:hypothetical protein